MRNSSSKVRDSCFRRNDENIRRNDENIRRNDGSENYLLLVLFFLFLSLIFSNSLSAKRIKAKNPNKKRLAAAEKLAPLAIKAVQKEFPVIKNFKLFVDFEEKALLKNYFIYFVSTQQIVPQPPYYYVAVHRRSKKARIINLVELKAFNAFARAERFSLKTKKAQTYFARIYLHFHVTRGEFLDKLTAQTVAELKKKKKRVPQERGLTFYKRKSGGGRLIFFSYQKGGKITRFDLSLSARGEILKERKKDL